MDLCRGKNAIFSHLKTILHVDLKNGTYTTE